MVTVKTQDIDSYQSKCDTKDWDETYWWQWNTILFEVYGGNCAKDKEVYYK